MDRELIRLREKWLIATGSNCKRRLSHLPAVAIALFNQMIGGGHIGHCQMRRIPFDGLPDVQRHVAEQDHFGERAGNFKIGARLQAALVRANPVLVRAVSRHARNGLRRADVIRR